MYLLEVRNVQCREDMPVQRYPWISMDYSTVQGRTVPSLPELGTYRLDST